MAFVAPKDRVIEHSLTSGNGPYALSGAIDTSCNAFSASMSIGDTTYGAIVEPGVAFAVGILTYSAANQITLTTTDASKGTFGGGTKEIFMCPPAVRQLLDTALATSAQFLAATSGKVLEAAAVWASAAEVSLTDGSSATLTFTNGSANISWTGAPAVNGAVHLTNSGGALPTNFSANTEYYVLSNSGSVVTLSATRGGSAIVAGSAGSGTQTGVGRVLVDLSLGVNFVLNTIGGNRTFAKPINAKAGQQGRIRIVQDGTGSRTATFNSADGWLKQNAGASIVLSTPAASDDRLYYDAVSASSVGISATRGWQ